MQEPSQDLPNPQVSEGNTLNEKQTNAIKSIAELIAVCKDENASDLKKQMARKKISKFAKKIYLNSKGY
jgi:hypothetical protein